MSEEAKQKISEAMKGEKNPRYGIHLSKETKEKLSEALSGEKHPMYGKHHSEETKKKMSENSGRAKPVICLETGEIFPSASAASKKCGLYRTVVNVYLGKTEEYRKNHTCGGYHWEWA